MRIEGLSLPEAVLKPYTIISTTRIYERLKGLVLSYGVSPSHLHLLEEGRQKKGEQEAKKKVEKELTAFLEQVETAKADAVVEYKASQSFIVSCGGYYGVGFEDCLKQAKSLYPHLDFSKVTMDEPMPSTPAGDIIQEETDDSTESRPKDDSVVLAQLATDAPITSLVPLTEPKIVEDLVARDKADGNSPNPIVS